MPQKTNVTLNTYPELVKEWHPTNNQGKVPKDFAQFSNKKVWWKCNLGPDHEWESTIAYRTKNKTGCPFCKNMRVSITNRFDLNQKEMMKEWNYEKNTILPSEITIGTNKKVWWKCTIGHEWEAKVASRVQAGYGCGACGNEQSGKKKYIKGDWVESNSELLNQWNYEKNDILGKPSDFSSGSTKKVWWKCHKGPDHEWEAEIRKRVIHNNGCPFCSGKKLSVTNSFVIKHPELAKEFHKILNKDIDINKLFENSGKKVWWKCHKGPDHEWEVKVNYRVVRESGCPFCTGKYVSDTNSLANNAPDIAKQFDIEKNFPKLPKDYAIGSNEEVWWKCDNPDHRGWKAPIAARMRQSIGCYICNQEERFASESRLFDIVKEIYPELKVERAIRPKWLDGLEIDIYVPELQLAIEYQGRQHYEPIEFFGGEKAFKNRVRLDEKKRKLLKEKNIHLLEWKYTIEMNKKRVKKEINKII
tara:strand:+ start:62 stop:1480 length:1419 start_codon:yes stop_codon:yes gene_type:complete